MSWLNTLFLLVAAILAVFWAAAFPFLRLLLGAQVDLLPALMVYAGLRSDITGISLAALVGGLAFDSLSSNPLGVTPLPLLVIGLVMHAKRDLLLRDQAFAQMLLGLAASAAAPAMTLLILLTTGNRPLLGWGTLWQFVVMSVGGALATPILFWLFEWLERTFTHGRIKETSFRPDREIRRGR